MSYQLLLTDAGAAKVAAAANAGGLIHLTDFVIGQGVNVDFSTRLDKQVLVSKRYQGKVQSVTPKLGNPRQYEITCIVPPDVGGFTIREFGLIDDAGVLVWVGSLPEVQKPDATSTAAVDYRIKAVVQVDNPQVSIVIDANVVTATQAWVNANFAAIGHIHQDMLDRLTALENRIYEAIAVGGIYSTVKNYANGDEVNADLHYGKWDRYAQGRILAGYSTLASDGQQYKTMLNVFAIGSEIEQQEAIATQFWVRLPDDYVEPTLDLFFTSDSAGNVPIIIVNEGESFYLWASATDLSMPITPNGILLSYAGSTFHDNGINLTLPSKIDNGKTLLASITADQWSVDNGGNPAQFTMGFNYNKPYTGDKQQAAASMMMNDNQVPVAPVYQTMKVTVNYYYPPSDEYGISSGGVSRSQYFYTFTQNPNNLQSITTQNSVKQNIFSIVLPETITDLSQLQITNVDSTTGASMYDDWLSQEGGSAVKITFDAATHTLSLNPNWITGVPQTAQAQNTVITIDYVS